MAAAAFQNRKTILATAGIAIFGLGAYGLGRVYPPLGQTAGTVAPAQRYVSSQVGEGDVTLGDTAVPELLYIAVLPYRGMDAALEELGRPPGPPAKLAPPTALCHD